MQAKNPCPFALFLSFFLTLTFLQSAKAQSLPAIPENSVVQPAKPYSVSFLWKGDSVNGRWEPHSAMLLPVRLHHCPRPFYMQFDLGSPISLVYKNKLEQIHKKYPKAVDQITPDGLLTDFHFQAGRTSIEIRTITVRPFESSGINWANKKEIEVIGTIGVDLIDGKVLSIDYPNQRITVLPDINQTKMAVSSFAGFVYTNRSILLPVKLNGKNTILFFDTGSSRFELLTDKKTSETMAPPGAIADTSFVSSWGRALKAYTLPTSDSIETAGTKLPLRHTTYIEGATESQVAQMMKLGIGGMTGNKLFLDHILVLDTKNKRFALIRTSDKASARSLY